MLKLITRFVWNATDYPITIAEMKSAAKDLDRLLSNDQREELISCLAFNPECGEIIPGTGGIRKFRWGMDLKGKSKGLRVMYYFRDLNMPLYVLAVYSKGEILRLTKREEREMAKLIETIVSEHSIRMLAAIAKSDRA